MMKVVKDNIATRSEIAKWWALCRDGATPLIADEDAAFVDAAKGLLPDSPWNDQSWAAWTAAVKEATGRKGRKLFMPLRKALTGMDSGPDMSKLMPLLQKINL